ncbi:MAG: adaptor protein MecA [Oscillospiraceae bacterium]|nr:adaptor protein MecA [Oscillospiraceae bacterium]
MRIEKLNSDKIKVTLTSADLINLNIDVEQLAPDSKELHTFLFHIMETIREETGFNPYSGQIVVEAMPSSDGIIIMVSRLKTTSAQITKERFNKATSVKAKRKTSTRTEIFYFERFEDMCAAITETDEGSLAAGSLYKLNNTYCFTIKNELKHAKCIHTMYEFSAKKSAYPLQTAYIKEHGRLIAKGKDLVNMAEKIRQLT